MTALSDLIDKIKNDRKLNSDAALARLVGVTPASVSNWKHGRNYPDTVQCARIADLAGEPLSRVLGIVGEARAISADEKRVWRRLAQAAAVAAVAMMAGWMPSPAQASNQAMAQPEQNAAICIMRSVDWHGCCTGCYPA